MYRLTALHWHGGNISITRLCTKKGNHYTNRHSDSHILPLSSPYFLIGHIVQCRILHIIEAASDDRIGNSHIRSGVIAAVPVKRAILNDHVIRRMGGSVMISLRPETKILAINISLSENIHDGIGNLDIPAYRLIGNCAVNSIGLYVDAALWRMPSCIGDPAAVNGHIVRIDNGDITPSVFKDLTIHDLYIIASV